MEKLIIFLFVIVFGIIRTLIEKSAEKKAAQARLQPRDPRLRGKPDAEQRVQSELEAFLSDVPARKGEAAAQGRSAGPVPAAVGRVQSPRSSSSSPDRPRQAARQKTKRRGTSAPGSSAPRKARGAAGDRSSDFVEAIPVRPATGTKGSGVRDHVNQYMHPHADSRQNSHMDDDMRSDPGSGRSTDSGRAAAGATPGAAADLLAILRSPQGMRQAILVHEVLSRPRALRR